MYMQDKPLILKRMELNFIQRIIHTFLIPITILHYAWMNRKYRVHSEYVII